MGLRPEHIEQGRGRDAQVVRVEHLGDQTRLHLKIGTHDVITLTDPHTTINPGDTVPIAPSNPLYFDGSGARIS
jgi:multiple sugar transport system ATP-binding protein